MATSAYFLAIRLAAPFNHQAKAWVEGRKNWAQKLQAATTDWNDCIWFHCASLGEFEQARPLIELHKSKQPNTKIVLSFFSPSGYSVRKHYNQADYVCYLPADTPGNAKKWFEIVQPRQIIFVRYELWYYFLKAAHLSKARTLMICASFRADQIFFKWYGIVHREILGFFDKIYTRDKVSFDRIKVLVEPDRLQIAGDTRFDRVLQISKQNFSLPELEKQIGDRKVLIAGSTWPEDESLITAWRKDPKWKNWLLIIAPHHVDVGNVNRLLASLEAPLILLSELEIDSPQRQVIIVDSIGQLAYLYRYATVAYIGGGFGTSVHNVLEAAVYEVPVFFGPIHHKQQECAELIEAGGGFCVEEEEEFLTHIEKLKAKNEYKAASQASVEYIEKHEGSLEVIRRDLF